MTPALARRIGKTVALLGSPEDGEALAAARAIGRTLEAAGMDWHAFAAMVQASAETKARLRQTFATIGRREAQSRMSTLTGFAARATVSSAEAAKVALLRERLVTTKKKNLSADEIAWLDALWERSGLAG